MGFKVKVVFKKGNRTRYYGTGELGKGKPYKTMQGAQKRLDYLKNLFKGNIALASTMKIIQEKAREENLNILDDVAFFLANTTNDLKILIQYFVSLQTHTSLYQRKIDMSTVKSIIKNINIYQRSLNDIQKLTAEYFNINMSDLLSNKKSRDFSYPRQVGMYLCRKLTDLSFKDIGRAFGNKDHSTVIYAVKRIEKEKNKKQGVLNDINKLQNFLL